MGNLEQAVTDAIGKMMGRKNGAAIVAMAFIYMLRDQTWQFSALIAGIAVVVIGLQFLLDLAERKWLGKDLPENGNGDTATPPIVNPAPDGTSQR